MKIQELRRLVSKYGESIRLGDVLKRVKGDYIYECPKCKGEGFMVTYYDAYPPGLPDSGWVTDMKPKHHNCDLCNGKGYTDKELKPKYKTELVGYE
ncbi:hypothetical protein [Bacillus thuringiensis]|uniref:hypothetical protein n=1 Tax=Bacillus thuringiensis TaxID=1428 RepID=UPI000BFE4656|nr:hypothetical protein [Bacillus thuringiensis]PGY46863.1 hypothetical protein COE09_23010 [Bacillus thuringiensis]